MAAHKPMEKKRKKMMYGRTPMKKGTMPRYGFNDGGPAVMASMENQKPV